MSDTKYCKDCKNIECPEGRVNCKYPDAIACAFYRDTPPTVFQIITTSPAVLADKLVFYEEDVCMNGKVITHWTSNVIQRSYNTREEAIAATIDALNEPRENEVKDVE